MQKKKGEIKETNVSNLNYVLDKYCGLALLKFTA